MRSIQFHQIPHYIHQGAACLMILIGGGVALILLSPFIIMSWIQERLQKPKPRRR